tara:strand:+ start:135347 stop:136189 length:843 start_codon:yes stop_codon:yes gene_type:complete
MGALAVFLANSYFSGVEQRNKQVAEDLNVGAIVAARVPMRYGDVITPDKLKLVQWPASSVPEGAFTDIRRLTADPSGPRVALRPIEAGQPVLNAMLTGAGGRAVISATLPKEKRAVAIRVNDVAGVGGFVLPGDSVDVLLTHQPDTGPDGRSQQITDIVVENVRVIAADQNANDASKDPQLAKTVTLEVDPTQAQKLVLAGQVGSLSLALRNAANQDEAGLSTMTVNDLTSGYSGPAASYRPVAAYRQPRRVYAPVRRPAEGYTVIVGKGLSVTRVEVKP